MTLPLERESESVSTFSFIFNSVLFSNELFSISLEMYVNNSK